MKLTEKQLLQIEEYASSFMTWTEIAILMGLNTNELKEELGDKKSPAYLSYQKGKLQSKHEINMKLTKLAKLGSPQAEILIRDEIKSQKIAESDL